MVIDSSTITDEQVLTMVQPYLESNQELFDKIPSFEMDGKEFLVITEEQLDELMAVILKGFVRALTTTLERNKEGKGTEVPS